MGLHNTAATALANDRFTPEERVWTPSDRRRVAQFFRDVQPLIEADVESEKSTLRDYLASIGMTAPGARPLIVDIGWRASSQRLLEKAIPELKGTAGAYFGLSDDAYRNGRMQGWFFDGFHPFGARWLATACVEILEFLFSAPHPMICGIESSSDGPFAPLCAPLTPDQELLLECTGRVGEGVMDFTRLLQEREASGHSIEIDQTDVAEFIRAIVMNPRDEELDHLGALPHALGLGLSSLETLLPQHPPRHTLPLLGRILAGKPTRLTWTQGLTRAIGRTHGRRSRLEASIVLSLARPALAARERLDRWLGR